VLASVASALVNLPLVQRNVRNPALFRRLAVVTFILCVLGLLILAVREFHRFWNL
jgi:formate-dependent nitrite reductase membrane component NrfD